MTIALKAAGAGVAVVLVMVATALVCGFLLSRAQGDLVEPDYDVDLDPR